MQKSVIQSIATLVGMTIGAGILGLPYVIAKAGFLVGAINIVIVGLAILMLNLYVGEVALRTEGRHELAGYAERYMGRKGRLAMGITTIIAMYGALIAYLIGEGAIISVLFGIDKAVAIILFFIVINIFIIKGLHIVKRAEVWISLGVIALLLFIILASIGRIELENLANINLAGFMLPYGVILFAFLGSEAVPEMKEILIQNKKGLKKAIMIGTLIPLIAYLLFAFAVVGVTGAGTTEVGTIGLGEKIGPFMLVIGNLLGFLTMASSYIAIGLALRWTFQYDLKINKALTLLFVLIPPLAVALAGIAGFVQVLGITGALAGGVSGMLLVVMHHRAKHRGDRKPEYSIKGSLVWSLLLIILFAAGIVYMLL